MTWSPSTLNILDASGVSHPVIAYTDGTNYAFAHPLLDSAGAIIAPATAGNQTTMIGSLASIAVNSALSSTSALQTSGNTILSSIDSALAGTLTVAITGTVPLATGASTAALQTTGNTSLATIATNTTGVATAANQATGNTSLASIAASTANIPASPATSAKQDTGNTSLATIVTNTTSIATAALQTTANTSLASIATNTGNIPAKGSATSANSTPVVIASDQAALPLPTGASTAANQATGNASLATIATAVAAAPIPLLATGNTTTRPNDTTAYALGDLWANSTSAGSVTYPTISPAKANDQAFTLLRCRLKKSGTVITNAIFRVHLYNVLPSVTNGDNGAWLSTQAGYLGSFDVTIDKVFSDASEGIGVPTTGSCIVGMPVSGAQTLYYLIEVRAAYTPVANEVLTPYLEVA